MLKQLNKTLCCTSNGNNKLIKTECKEIYYTFYVFNFIYNINYCFVVLFYLYTKKKEETIFIKSVIMKKVILIL